MLLYLIDIHKYLVELKMSYRKENLNTSSGN